MLNDFLIIELLEQPCGTVFYEANFNFSAEREGKRKHKLCEDLRISSGAGEGMLTCTDQ